MTRALEQPHFVPYRSLQSPVASLQPSAKVYYRGNAQEQMNGFNIDADATEFAND